VLVTAGHVSYSSAVRTSAASHESASLLSFNAASPPQEVRNVL
jgi:hypothetical protein